jgi:transposase-like protein
MDERIRNGGIEAMVRVELRDWMRQTLQRLMEAELEAVLGVARYGRGTRCGYRHARRARTITTTVGPTTVHSAFIDDLADRGVTAPA